MSYEFIRIGEQWYHHFPKPTTLSVWDKWLSLHTSRHEWRTAELVSKRQEIARKYWGIR